MQGDITPSHQGHQVQVQAAAPGKRLALYSPNLPS